MSWYLLASSKYKQDKKVSFVAKQTSARHVKEALPPSSFFSMQSSVLPASLALPLFGATRKKLPTQLNPLITPSRAAKEYFVHARLQQGRPHHGRTIAATGFYFSKSRQDQALTGVTSLGGPTILCCAFFSRT